VFIPLHDANSLKHIRLQFVTIGLILANITVFFLSSTGSQDQITLAQLAFSFIPAEFEGGPPVYETGLLIPEGITLFSYAFFHGDLLHLGGNLLFLWVFGDNVEDAMGHFKFLIFYLLCAAGGALMHNFASQGSQVPLIGASGAIAGVLAAYLVLHPKVKIWVLAFARIPIRIPAWIVLILWMAIQVFMLLSAPEDEVSWAAHVGGIIAGLVLVFVFKRRDVPLFDRSIVLPKAVQTLAPGEMRTSVPVTRWGRSNDKGR
jgi:membrane associated rhomboid family serine protease